MMGQQVVSICARRNSLEDKGILYARVAMLV
jgi:hypothetical protein